ncbi:hypothetical protein DN745_13370 [Bradymonas sediminis]|uniref:Sodium-translocating pyrophosphatase n=1 Tax=Bradymonas sediminis TaxID=1548548 RepID=A0A2Z4FNG5_9DELT|nr:hypothetical protein DN745_13370 [Bradymonas sediminis]
MRNRETHYEVFQEEFDASKSNIEVVDKDTAEVIAGGSMVGVVLGAGAATLGILGLIGFMPMLFTTIGMVAVGAGLIIAGGSMGAKYSDILSSSTSDTSSGAVQAGGGITAETIGGAAGVALGVLAMMGVESLTLIPVGLIVLGGAMAFGAAATMHLSRLVISASGAPRFKQRVANESIKGGAFMQMVAGLGAAVLGVLSLLGVGAGFTFGLVGVIALGGGLLLSGLAVGGKLINMLYNDDSHAKAKVSGRPVYREYHSSADRRPV